MKEFEAGLYISKAAEIVKCPYCKDGFAEYYLRTSGSRYYLCSECGNDVDITPENEMYYTKIQLTLEDAEELFNFVEGVACGIDGYDSQRARKMLEAIRRKHRKVIQEDVRRG